MEYQTDDRLDKINRTKKGQAAAPGNRIRYQDYKDSLEATCQKFPSNQYGEVNKTEVARKCCFNRQVLIKGALKKEFEKDVCRIGVKRRSELQVKEEDRAKKAQENTRGASRPEINGSNMNEEIIFGSSSLRMGNGMMAPFPIRRYYDYAT
ncbi:MAG: hypothetical protein AB9919_13245 [Geobacteraceae bacterium]